MNSRLKTQTMYLLAAIGLGLIASSSYMNIKAMVAQKLISSSWESGLSQQAALKPWRWADTRPIARLVVPRLAKEVFVMQDDSGESLAFGPGHLSASSAISEHGHVMISGHRDSHFSFLRDLKLGDDIETQNIMGTTIRYRIISTRILDIEKDELIKQDNNQLSLITCYPFDDFIPGGPLRYIVDAIPIENSQAEVASAIKTRLKDQTTTHLQPKHYLEMHENMVTTAAL